MPYLRVPKLDEICCKRMLELLFTYSKVDSEVAKQRNIVLMRKYINDHLVGGVLSSYVRQCIIDMFKVYYSSVFHNRFQHFLLSCLFSNDVKKLDFTTVKNAHLLEMLTINLKAIAEECDDEGRTSISSLKILNFTYYGDKMLQSEVLNMFSTTKFVGNLTSINLYISRMSESSLKELCEQIGRNCHHLGHLKMYIRDIENRSNFLPLLSDENDFARPLTKSLQVVQFFLPEKSLLIAILKHCKNIRKILGANTASLLAELHADGMYTSAIDSDTDV